MGVRETDRACFQNIPLNIPNNKFKKIYKNLKKKKYFYGKTLHKKKSRFPKTKQKSSVNTDNHLFKTPFT